MCWLAAAAVTVLRIQQQGTAVAGGTSCPVAELRAAERLNHQGAAGALPLSIATETDE